MGQTVEQIEAHIDTTRGRLGSNLQELERKVDAMTDWREHFQTRPFTLLAVAFAGGVVLAASLRGRTARRPYRYSTPAMAASEPHAGTKAQKYRALETWDNIKGALIGVAAARVKDYVGQLIPGFHEQFERTERRAASSFPHGQS
jgi:hypothetical protein